MKHLLFSVLIFFNITLIAQESYINNLNSIPEHPRILINSNKILQIKENINNNKTWRNIHNAIINESLNIINESPLKRIKEGKRMLDVSREALRRIFYLSYSYIMTNNQIFKNRAEKELITISNFKDWNPDHFLDVAEMTMAAAIGYDWLYNDINNESRTIIKEAILNKGLKPSLDSKFNSWLNTSSNWNQVCNCGVTFGALAIYENIPQYANNLINRAINSIKIPMKEYYPDGAYPEGFGYWSYGTSFNVMFLSAIENIFKTDFSLSKTQGFLESGYYIENMITPSKRGFNYGDSRSGSSLNPTLFWISNKINNTEILWSQLYYLKNREAKSFTKNRLLPAILIWGSNVNIYNIKHPNNYMWVGKGTTPVATIRTSWTDPNASFIGFKAGSAGTSHAHMDIGSFIIESQGEQWAIDLGMQDYNSLESAGIDLWNKSQDSQRWDVYRYNNFSHNTITFDNQKQLVKGYATIYKSGEKDNFMFAVADLTDIYKNKIKKCKRGVGIKNKRTIIIQDEITTRKKSVKFIWTMMTKASVRKIGANKICLTINNKNMYLSVNNKIESDIYIEPAIPHNSYDAPNPNVTRIRIGTKIPANSFHTNCIIISDDNYNKITYNTPLSKWE